MEEFDNFKGFFFFFKLKCVTCKIWPESGGKNWAAYHQTDNNCCSLLAVPCGSYNHHCMFTHFKLREYEKHGKPAANIHLTAETYGGKWCF